MNRNCAEILKVGFFIQADSSWIGGVNYQFNLIEAIRVYAPQVEAHLLLPPQSEEAWPDDRRVVKHYLPGRRAALEFANRAIGRLFELNIDLEQILRKLSLDLTFSWNPYLGRFKPAIFWVADFQHIHLPEMFSIDQIRTRNRYIKGAHRAGIVVLSSEDASRDFCQFLPEYSQKARVMRFASSVPQSIYETNPMTVLGKYEIPKKFIYLPNQFWKHKNHILVLEALRHLGTQGITPVVVCTGNQKDLRQPTYFAELEQRVTLWGLRDQIKFLGVLPKTHVHQLIRQSVCVLNPSLFEGWSTTVEEAKSIGKRILLSDLRVHHEQNPSAAIYFDPRNPADLAEKMSSVWFDGAYGPDLELEMVARRELPERLRTYAESFASIARETITLAQRGQPQPS